MSAANWIEVLRAACAGGKQKAVALKVGYSAAVISAVLNSNYKGDLSAVQRAVEGALMQAVVDCPVVGEIPQQRCVAHQRAPFRATNPTAVQLYRACRGGCPNALNAGGAGKEKPCATS